MKIKIELPNGKTILRTPIGQALGNFSFLVVRYKNKEYVVNDGDEYLRGYPDSYRLKFECNCAGIGKPQYIIYQEDRDRMAKETEYMKNLLFKNYIELS